MKIILPLVLLMAIAFTSASVPASHNKGSSVKIETKLKDASVQTLDDAIVFAIQPIEMAAVSIAPEYTPVDVYAEAITSESSGRINDPPDRQITLKTCYQLRC